MAKSAKVSNFDGKDRSMFGSFHPTKEDKEKIKELCEDVESLVHELNDILDNDWIVTLRSSAEGQSLLLSVRDGKQAWGEAYTLYLFHPHVEKLLGMLAYLWRRGDRNLDLKAIAGKQTEFDW